MHNLEVQFLVEIPSMCEVHLKLSAIFQIVYFFFSKLVELSVKFTEIF